MHREYQRWFSPSLGRDMELLVFGHAGARTLAFPTSRGRFHEWEDHGMTAAVAEHLELGWLQLYCLDSVDDESWYATHLHPDDRARRQDAYERYLLHEVLPLSRHRNPNPYCIATGASFGAYHAVDFALRHPHLVGRVLAMSGLYDIREMTGGFSSEAVYWHNPADFLRGEHDPGRLDALRRMDIILVTGRDDQHCWSTRQLSDVLWAKDIRHALRIWNCWGHDWPYWHRMLRQYVGGYD